MIYINPYLSVPINTIIGGVAGTISTKSALATKLGISESIITRFEIVGSDVYCRIGSEYSIASNAFNGNNDITFYNDIGGFCVRTGDYAFGNSTSFTSLLAPALDHLGFNTFRGSSNFTGVDYPNLKTLQSGCFYGTKITNALFPNLLDLSIGTLTFMSSTVVNVDLGMTNALGSQFFRNCTLLENLIANNVKTIDYDFLYNATKIQHINLPSVTKMTYNAFRNATSLKTVIAPNLNEITDKKYFFYNNTNLELIDFKKLKVFGTASAIDNCFAGLKLNCQINVNIALATTNAGAPDAALMYAKNSRSAIVKFYNDDGSYHSTL